MSEVWRWSASKKHLLPIFIIPVLAFVIHIPLRKVPEPWFDESATIGAIRRSPMELAQLLGNIDLVHGLYYYIAQAWSAVFVLNLPTLRALSVVMFSATLLVCGALAYLLASSHRMLAANCSMLVVATMPSIQWMAVDARGYVFMLFFFVLSLLLAKLDTEHNQTRLKVALACSMLAATLFSLMFALAVPIIAGYHWLNLPREQRRQAGFIHAATLALVGFFARACSGQIHQVGWISAAKVDLWENFSERQFFAGSQDVLPSDSWDEIGLATAQLMAVAILVIALLARTKWSYLLTSLLLLPTAALMFVHANVTPLYQPRYVSYTAVALGLLCAVGFVKKLWPLATIAALVLCVAQYPALEESAEPNGKFGETYRATAGLRCGADQVYYGNGVARSLTPVVEYCKPLDPMVSAYGPESGTLFGTQPDNYAAESIDYRGKVVVFQTSEDVEWLKKVEDTGKAKNCTGVVWIPSGRFNALVMECPR